MFLAARPRVLEIRYRIVAAGRAIGPFGHWFEASPDARVLGKSVRFEDDLGECVLVADPGSRPRAFEAAFDSRPLHGALLWRPEAPPQPGWLVRRGRWREPILPGVRSAMRVVHDVLGDAAAATFEVTRDGSVHSFLVEADEFDDAVWGALAQESARLEALTGAPCSVEVERFANHVPSDGLPLNLVVDVLAAAVVLGYYEEPSRASVADVALAADVSCRVAGECLERAHAEFLAAARDRL